MLGSLSTPFFRLNRLVSTKDALDQISRVTYDAMDNVVSSTDELSHATTYTYDGWNRLVTVTDSLLHSVTRKYDAVGNLTSLTDANLNTTTYGYDVRDRQITQTDARGGITRMTYDNVSNLKSVTDSVQNVTTYDYNQRNEIIRETNQFGKSRVFDYDKVGNLATKTDRNNRTTKIEYDELDRLKNEQWKDAANSTVRTFTYTFDDASRLTSAIDPDSSYSYIYDKNNQLTQVSNAGTVGVPTVLLNYGYDAVNNLVSTQDTIAGQVRGTTTLTRDRLNRVTQIQQSGVGVANKRVDMNYDAASQLKGIQRYTDLAGTQLVAATVHNYDLAGRLQDLTHRKANNATIANYSLTYDPGNRLTQLTSIDGLSVFNYDVTDQLTSADHATQTDENYGYDLNGNRTNGGYQTGGNNQLLTDGTHNYTYDDEGNRTSRTRIATGAVTEYVWDYRNRLTHLTEKNAAGVVTQSSSYKYDMFDRRIGKTVDLDGIGTQVTTTERYVYDDDHIALVFDGQGNQLQRFLYGTQVDQILAQENANGDLIWALADYQGSARDIIDSQGSLLNHIVYDSFGNRTSQTDGAISSRFGYTGRELDAETGLYYYRARYYDPQTGQFIGQDPIGFEGQDANLYRYVKNGSPNKIDPSGLSEMRYPSNGSVTNNSSRGTLVLNSKDARDDIEGLRPGESTPNSWGRSKDVDGVWLCEDDTWVFYGTNYGDGPHFTITDDGIYGKGGKQLTSSPTTEGRGRPDTWPADKKCDCERPEIRQYGDASKWVPIEFEDTLPRQAGSAWETTKKNTAIIGGTTPERVLNLPEHIVEGTKDNIEKGKRKIGETWDSLKQASNPKGWNWRIFR